MIPKRSQGNPARFRTEAPQVHFKVNKPFAVLDTELERGQVISCSPVSPHYAPDTLDCLVDPSTMTPWKKSPWGGIFNMDGEEIEDLTPYLNTLRD